MPIKASDRKRYPKDWKAITDRIRKRAGFRCECLGECGIVHSGHRGRCIELHGRKAVHFNGDVILTTAHLDHTPETRDETKLRAMCQRCHLRYDRHHHAKNAAATRAAKNPQGQFFGRSEIEQLIPEQIIFNREKSKLTEQAFPKRS